MCFFHFEHFCVYPHPLVFQLIVVVCGTSRNNLTASIGNSWHNILLSFICQVEGFQEKVPLKETGANCEKKHPFKAYQSCMSGNKRLSLTVTINLDYRVLIRAANATVSPAQSAEWPSNGLLTVHKREATPRKLGEEQQKGRLNMEEQSTEIKSCVLWPRLNVHRCTERSLTY